MPPSTRSETSASSNPPHTSKRAMSDAESPPQDPKKARTEPPSRPNSQRDTKRRRRKKKKVPVVDAGVVKNESQSDERPRPPPSARNEIIRFASTPPEGDLPTSTGSAEKRSPSPKPLDQVGSSSSQTLDDTTQDRSQVAPSTPEDTKHTLPADTSVPEPSSVDKVARLEAELKSKNNLIASHQALLAQIQQSVTCQVCLDLMYKPYALAPCGHLVCHTCLVSWFTAPPPDNRPVPPAIARRKTCPHCRAVVHERPIEVWGVKGIAQAIGRSELLPNLSVPIPIDALEAQDASADPWNDIFPKPGAPSRARVPWLFPGADIDDDDFAPIGEDIGMLDMEDGGIFRCLDCMHEIWDGACTSCGRVYPGHRPEGGDDEDEVGWLDDQIGAEEVDVADDPGWMGLEDGEADDGGDFDDWNAFGAFGRSLNVFRPWGFFGPIHVDEEDEEEDDDDEEGYESSFIDDDDEVGGPRIYEIDQGDGDENYHPDRRHDAIDLFSVHREDGHASLDDSDPRHGPVIASSEEEAEDDEVCGYHRRRGHGVVESDDSDAYWSDE